MNNKIFIAILLLPIASMLYTIGFIKIHKHISKIKDEVIGIFCHAFCIITEIGIFSVFIALAVFLLQRL